MAYNNYVYNDSVLLSDTYNIFINKFYFIIQLSMYNYI